MTQRLSPERLEEIWRLAYEFSDTYDLTRELFIHIRALEAEIDSLKQVKTRPVEEQVSAIRGAVERARAQVYELDRYEYNEYYEMMRSSSYGEYLDRDQVLDALAAPRVVLDLNERPAVVISKLIVEDHKRSGDY
jgi:hypothetical protein